MSNVPGHVSGKDIMPEGRRLNATAIFVIVLAAAIVLLVLWLTVPNLIPKSAEGKYNAEREMIRLAALSSSTGYPGRPLSGGGYGRSAGVSVVGLGGAGKGVIYGIWPTFAQANRGDAEAMKLEDVPSGEITTLGVFKSNPAGGARGGEPSWEDLDGGGRVPAADRLFYSEASPAPTEDHWNTETVVEFDGTAQYVIDSRDWFINLVKLVDDEYLDAIPASVSPDNHPDGTGSYSWYIDQDGKIQSMLYTNPALKGYQDVYP